MKSENRATRECDQGMSCHVCESFDAPRVPGRRVPRDPAVCCSPCDVPPEIAYRISCGKQSWKVGLSVQIDFHAAPDHKRLVLHELDHVPAEVNPFFGHVAQHTGVAFISEAPDHVIQILF